MLPLIQREVVDRQGWIDEQEFLNMIALAQAAPGLIAVNSAIFIGYQVGAKHLPPTKEGLKSRMYPYLAVIAAVLGAVLPSFLIILAIAMVFQDWKELPAVEAAFKGVRPAVVALIAAPLLKLAKSAKISWITAIIPVVAALLIWLGHVNPVWIILATIIITLCSIWLSSYRSSK